MLLKLEKTLFYLFIFLIPFQIRIFLHNASNEWNSIFLYAGDMVLATMLILWILRGGLKEIFGVFGGATSENRRSQLLLLFFSGVFQAILAIAQFIKQGSIGIKFIEAGVFSPDSPGVANFILNGERIMRSYG